MRNQGNEITLIGRILKLYQAIQNAHYPKIPNLEKYVETLKASLVKWQQTHP